MIPSDLAARLRMLTEASLFDSEPPLTGLARVREIQARLPELVPGTRFTATLQRPLPDGTFQAIVAGRSYTLALNHAARSGDTLELVVTGTTPKAVFAQLAQTAPGGTPAAGNDATRPNLSPVGRLIGFLLTGQPPARPVVLAGGKPILDAPPTANGAALAPALRQALAQSGLFYESHQQQWLAGKLDTAALLREPQGELPAARAQRPPSGTPLAESPAARPTPPSGAAGVSAAALPLSEEPAAAAAPRTAVVPERLIPVVHQQLDAMATQHYVWQGQVWPGQTMEWEIEDPQRERRGDDNEAAAEWNTMLRLALPRLGGVEAHLVLTGAGVALRLLADDDGTVGALADAQPQLAGALAAANVPLTGFVAERRDAR